MIENLDPFDFHSDEKQRQAEQRSQKDDFYHRIGDEQRFHKGVVNDKAEHTSHHKDDAFSIMSHGYINFCSLNTY